MALFTTPGLAAPIAMAADSGGDEVKDLQVVRSRFFLLGMAGTEGMDEEIEFFFLSTAAGAVTDDRPAL